MAALLGACNENCAAVSCPETGLQVTTEGSGAIEACVASKCATKNTQRNNPEYKISKASFSLSDFDKPASAVVGKPLPLTFTFTRTSDGLGAAGTTHAKWKKSGCCSHWELVTK